VGLAMQFRLSPPWPPEAQERGSFLSLPSFLSFRSARRKERKRSSPGATDGGEREPWQTALTWNVSPRWAVPHPSWLESAVTRPSRRHGTGSGVESNGTQRPCSGAGGLVGCGRATSGGRGRAPCERDQRHSLLSDLTCSDVDSLAHHRPSPLCSPGERARHGCRRARAVPTPWPRTHSRGRELTNRRPLKYKSRRSTLRRRYCPVSRSKRSAITPAAS
jgi:hypothetical protein